MRKQPMANRFGNVWWSAVTCVEDGHSHAVADGVIAEGGGTTGRFPARCGRLIAPVALTAPEGPPCPLCG